MKPSTSVRTLLVVCLALGAGLGAKRASLRNAVQMAEAANRLLAALPAEQRARASFAFDAPDRTRFHFIPTETFARQGVTVGEMGPAQREAARSLLRTGLSQRGYMTATQIMETEGILAGLEGGRGQFVRDPERYFVSVFGTPSTSGSWGWRWEGHHLSLHFTVVEGAVTVSSPTFFGANPAEVLDGPYRGRRVLGRQEDAGRALLGSLDPAQRAVAVQTDVNPRDVLARVALDPDPLAPVGVEARALSPAQRELLMEIVHAYTDVMAPEIAALRLTRLEQAGLDNLRFAWAGGTKRGEMTYFRVQGPTFLVELSNTMNDPNHIHSGWREFGAEFGRDLLAAHMRQDH
ncbi:MAG: DUF3500 domain-containing protein [Gemmatimonadetes bacterium]|nr:DUF3500 domain-containing protein [Gemmatimonadota bacterium]